jgi:rhamnosyltransferase
MFKIAAVVVLYNPDVNVSDNLNSYIKQVDRLYAVDNSDNDNHLLVDKVYCPEKIEYIWNKTNIGIAAALNIGVNRAVEEKFDYLLTMDQDSEASAFMVSNLLECFSNNSKVGVVSPLLQYRIGRKKNDKTTKSCEQVLSTWTSGNLVDLKVFQKIGGYKEDFFIDYVDHDFCLRLNKLGFKIYVCNKTILTHSLGKPEEVNLFFRKVYPTNHSPIRIYYRTRNRFYLKKNYKNIIPDFFKQDDIDFWKTLLKAVLFEKDRFKKIEYAVLGYIDYKKNRLGKSNRNYREK